MQYIYAATLAFALGASARPKAQWGGFPGGYFHFGSPDEYGSESSSPSFPSIAVSSGSGVSFPYGATGSGTGFATAGPTGFPSGVATYYVPSGTAAPSSSSWPAPESPPASEAAPVSSAAAASSSAPVSSAAAASSSASYSSLVAAVTSSKVVDSGSDSSGGSLPASSGTSALSAVQTIAAGDSFDCGMVAYDRGVDCTGQEEGGDSDAVFILENGASLSNCIIGPNQIEGVHCEGACKLTNVWWSAVCEDAFSIKEQADGETTTITGGGAFGAEDKVIQHNGAGTVSVSGFTVDNFGKLYRSCGNCDSMYERHVIMDDITATEGSVLAGINSNYGDTATFSNINVSGVDDVCVTYTGNDSGDEPEENGSGPSESCLYSESDISEI